MNENQLSKRLHCVASYIKKGMKIADIGSDHAYLPCYSVKQGAASFAVAGEIAEGPFQSAKEQVEKVRLGHLIDVRKGDGLEVVQPGEVDCIVIAGMGGPLITQILDKDKEKLAGVSRLILQPNIGAEHIRRWLLQNEWELIDEQILEEDGKIYEVLAAERGTPYKPYNESELFLGPFLLKKKNAVFVKKWSSELKGWQNILNSMDKAKDRPETEEKKRELLKKIAIVEEALS
ncbi:tRNA (adenine(22)-N(1))-methyltransferase TrmK [Siminovitchia fortis]|uniref:tRNA (Adenine-N(1))-methyltransferase n=1 Tax=Siminovitchia fortis TaxID=254758 RepID=A0A443J3W8_9BACI|nr:tRNA (adenine(22)-N(1))-methyltransferase TrmK [Siminovitchia fortis]RWR15139.1 tRNA (adenine-N(1))-methyltransferase [Siminovitchia fortis]WHY82723.1 tRNA (adenine(22)-N(1))-methyltransferase TrmK [Siminovitchia fortis]